MTAAESVRFAVRLFSPFALFAGFLLVVAGSAWAVDFVLGDLDYDWQNAHLNKAVSAAELVLGGAVFAAIGQALVYLEATTRPTFFDRVRRCCFFYVALAIVSVAVVRDYVAYRTEPLYRQEVATPTVDWLILIALPILIEALVLLRQRRRLDRATLEGVR